jgi:hypothetical protein
VTSLSRLVPSVTDLIVKEFRKLRKGRGIQAPDLDARLGPYLRELASVPHRGDVAELRQVLMAELNACAQRLTFDLRTAITASLGLSGQTREMANFTARAQWLADTLGREYRTALRRIEAAEQLLAEEVARELRRRRSRTPTTPDGWYLDEFSVLFRLDTPVPESWEQRRIVSTRAGLKEVMAWLDIPPLPGRPRPVLQGEVTHGGRLVRHEHPSGDKFQFLVELPVPLGPGDACTYGLHLRMSAQSQMTPHYIFTPECQCNVFDLRVRFDMSRPPVWVRRVEAEPVRMFASAQPEHDLLSPDGAGEVHVRFEQPAMYLGYGIQWRP